MAIDMFLLSEGVGGRGVER